MRTSFLLPVAISGALALAAAEEPAVYGNIKLTYTAPSEPTPVSLNLVGKREETAEYGNIPLTYGTTSASSVSLNTPTSKAAVSSSESVVYTHVTLTSYVTTCPYTCTVPTTLSGSESTNPATYSGKSTEAVSSKSSQPVTAPITYTTESVYYTTSTITSVVVVPCSGTTTISKDGTTTQSLYSTESTVTTTITTSVPVTTKCTITETPGHSTDGIPSSAPGYSGSESIPGYSGSESIPGYSGSMTIPGYSGSMTMPGHSGSETIPGYSGSNTAPVSYPTQYSHYPESSSPVESGVTSYPHGYVPSSASAPVSSEGAVSSSTGSRPASSVPASDASCLSMPSNAHTRSRTRASHSIGRCTASGCSSSGTASVSVSTSSSKSSVTSSTSASDASCLSMPSNAHTRSRTRASHSIGRCTASACGSSGFLSSTGFVSSSATSSCGTMPNNSGTVCPTRPAYSSSPSSGTVSKSVPTSSGVSSGVGSSSAPKSSAAVTSSTQKSSAVVSSGRASGSNGYFPAIGTGSSANGDSWGTYTIPSSLVRPSVATASAAPKSSSATSSKSGSTSTTPYACSTPTAEPECIPCDGQPGNDPATWCGLDINTDYYTTAPITCKTVTYNFTVTNTTLAPDGYDRYVQVINGQYPGPLIEASWGDTIIVNVHNGLANNGTSIHFHGMRQNYTNEMDGATSITQSPIAPGHSMTYKFRAVQYGTSWYHSHFALQAWEGVMGPMKINGPTSASFDSEADVLTLSDWSYQTVDEMFVAAETVGSFPEHGPRIMDTGLINGMNVGSYGGMRYTLSQEFETGNRYLIRLVNTAIQATFKFSIDSHQFQIIANDYVPITPYTAETVILNPGQRYDIVVTADQTPASYWMRADAQTACSNVTDNMILGIVNYQGFSDTPTSTQWTYADECVDEPSASLVPVLSKTVGAESDLLTEIPIISANGGSPNLYKWTLNGQTFVSKWDTPTLYSVSANDTLPDYTGSLQVQHDLGEWVYLLIETPIPLPHPIHLHGHDFYVLGSGTGFYGSETLNTVNPPRRDTALLPWGAPVDGDTSTATGGWLVLAWETDNPGAWLAHCHIGWHATMGFSLAVIDGNLEEIQDAVSNSCQLDATVNSWNAYASADSVQDLGI